jgi:hypothetical protein
MLKAWTIGRATGAGAIAAGASLLLWALFTAWPERLLWPLAIALAVTAFCGLSILWITARDMSLGPKRGVMLRAIRGFDVALGLLLAVPPLYVLSWLWPELGL